MGVQWIPSYGTFGGEVPVAACTCTAIEAALFRRLGGYDEMFPLYGAAEPEFSVRAWLSGFQVLNLPDLHVYHRFRFKSDREQFEAQNNLVLLRNYLTFACCYLPEPLLPRAFHYFSLVLGHHLRTFLADLEVSGIWGRRSQIKQSLPRSFDWYIDRFALKVA
jgi:GT2 family glycosyltransferase